GLDSVLAEFERGAVLGVAPGAAGAIEAVGLVGFQHRSAARKSRSACQQLLAATLQRAPAAGCLRLLPDEFVLTHGPCSCRFETNCACAKSEISATGAQ